MHVLVVGAAPAPGMQAFYQSLLAESRFVVACDAAAEQCLALGRRPDLAVGDFDSAAPGAVERLEELAIPVRVHPADKDESDLDLAVREARRLGATRLTLTAAFSARIDHTLAAIGTLGRAADLYADAREPSFSAWALDGRCRDTLEIEGADGLVVSVFAVGEATGVTVSGFGFPLDDAELSPLSSLGLSNRMAGGHGTIKVRTGRLVVVAPIV